MGTRSSKACRLLQHRDVGVPDCYCQIGRAKREPDPMSMGRQQPRCTPYALSVVEASPMVFGALLVNLHLQFTLNKIQIFVVGCAFCNFTGFRAESADLPLARVSRPVDHGADRRRSSGGDLHVVIDVSRGRAPEPPARGDRGVMLRRKERRCAITRVVVDSTWCINLASSTVGRLPSPSEVKRRRSFAANVLDDHVASKWTVISAKFQYTRR